MYKRQLLNKEVYVAEFPITEKEPLLQNLQKSGLLRPNTVLIQSPFNTDVYEDASVCVKRFAVSKHLFFSAFCKALGAKEVSVNQIELRNSRGLYKFDASGERLGTTAELSAEKEDVEKLRSELVLKDVFDGGAPNIELATEIINKHSLQNEPVMTSLLDAFTTTENPFKERMLSLSLTSEVNKCLTIVANLDIPAVIKIGANYRQTFETQTEYYLTLKVVF